MKFLKKIVVNFNRKMADRKRRKRCACIVNEVASRLKETRKAAVVLGTVEYANLGDQAICVAQKEFLAQYLPVFEIRDSVYKMQRKMIKKHIRPQDIIVIPGGGNMGNLWAEDEMRRRMVIQDYPHNKVIVFPQTIDYEDCDEGLTELHKSQKLYNAHSHLVLCARERKSYDTMRKVYDNCKIILVPDIVLSLKTQTEQTRNPHVILCMRNDKEKNADEKLIKSFVEKLELEQISYHTTDTVRPGLIQQEIRERAVAEKIAEFASGSITVTDRLHGMIFCAISGTPCIVMPNSNHKIKGVYEEWLKKYPWIHFMEKPDVEQMMKIIEQAVDTSTAADHLLTIAEEFKPLVEELTVCAAK